MNCMRTVLFAALLLTLTLPAVLGISISSERITNPILFIPGDTHRFSYVVSDYQADAEITLDGDWAKYATISDVTQPRQGEKHFVLDINPPAVPEKPGIHFIYIGAREAIPEGGDGVGAVAAVRKQIMFKVLFNHKQARAELVAPDVNIGDPVEFQVGVTSETLQRLNDVSATIEVTDGTAKQIAVLQTDSISLDLGQGKVLEGTLDTTGYQPATYHARAVVHYDGNVTYAEDSFRVGTLALHIINFTDKVEVGKISPFTITVESGWNDVIDGLYGEVFVNKTLVAKTPTTSINPWAQENLTAYVDATEWSTGTYDTLVTVHFADNSTTKKGPITAFERKEASASWIAGIGMTHLLIAAVAVLAILLVANLYLLKKRRGPGEEK